MNPSNPFSLDRRTGLLLPFTCCSTCGSERLYRDLKGNLRCMRCVPPHTVLDKLRKEKLAAIARERQQVDNFIDEDEDIQNYNLRHHGVKTS